MAYTQAGEVFQMPRASDLLLIFEPDRASHEVLCAVASRLGCEYVEVGSSQELDQILRFRQPNIAVLAVDRFEADGSSLLRAIVQHGARPATLLVGAISGRLLAAARRAAESLGLPVVGVAPRPLDAQAIERLLVPHLTVAPPIPAAELERALVEQELTLHYQPKLSIIFAEPSIQAVEALVRWQHPRRGLLHPSQFLRSFEDHGLLPNLTDFVITEALRQAGLWRSRGTNLGLVVNLSPGLVRDREFPERLATLFREFDFKPQNLVLEVPELPSTQDRNLLLELFTRLRVLGVGLCLDNFATGAMSLADLYRLPFSEVSVSQALLTDALHEHDAGVVVRAIADLAHGLHIPVCAKGIESRRTLQLARSSGFDSAQGRFFSDAVPAAEVEQLVAAWPRTGPAASGSWRTVPPLETDGSATTVRMRQPQIADSKVAE
jgi:EAL domain-containing protein (putative c-di-GMP-specific phosphodiesterase class I)